MYRLADSVMDQKASASSFTLAELRDLFTLDEETDCQTHDLLGCDCNGAGDGGCVVGVEPNISTDGASRAAGVEPSTDELHSERKRKRKVHSGMDRNSNDSEGVYDSDDQSNTDPPNGQLPGLMKASEVDMVKIEEVSPNSHITSHINPWFQNLPHLLLSFYFRAPSRFFPASPPPLSLPCFVLGSREKTLSVVLHMQANNQQPFFPG